MARQDGFEVVNAEPIDADLERALSYLRVWEERGRGRPRDSQIGSSHGEKSESDDVVDEAADLRLLIGRLQEQLSVMEAREAVGGETPAAVQVYNTMQRQVADLIVSETIAIENAVEQYEVAVKEARRACERTIVGAKIGLQRTVDQRAAKTMGSVRGIDRSLSMAARQCGYSSLWSLVVSLQERPGMSLAYSPVGEVQGTQVVGSDDRWDANRIAVGRAESLLAEGVSNRPMDAAGVPPRDTQIASANGEITSTDDLAALGSGGRRGGGHGGSWERDAARRNAHHTNPIQHKAKDHGRGNQRRWVAKNRRELARTPQSDPTTAPMMRHARGWFTPLIASWEMAQTLQAPVQPVWV
jgi:hypothetical protein